MRRKRRVDEPRRDDLPAVKVSRLRAEGVISPLMDKVEVEIGGHTREVGLWHMFFPNDGSWSYFLCPSCGRKCQTLRLHDGRFVCASCDGLLLRCQTGDKGPRIERLRLRLAAKSKKRPAQTEWALRQALIAKRRERLKGWPPKA
jgi:predicted RNA-binding Zn-ribbon protein involved in translation (DUF1610 family)